LLGVGLQNKIARHKSESDTNKTLGNWESQREGVHRSGKSAIQIEKKKVGQSDFDKSRMMQDDACQMRHKSTIIAD
jgi:hypothetical protein